MITAVDSNILIDILEPDPVHGLRSKEALKRCLREGSVVACDVVWAEVATAYGHDSNELVEALRAIYHYAKRESRCRHDRCRSLREI